MSLSITQVAEAFSRHEFAQTYPYFSDAIHWNLVGSEPITGKENVMQACEQSSAYLKTVTTTFAKFLVISDGNQVVTDCESSYIGANQPGSTVASCDIYRFENEKLIEITSYTIELKTQEKSTE